MLLTGSSATLVISFIQILSREFSMKDLGPVHNFLGIEISPTTDGLHLSQSHYALTILDCSSMLHCKPMGTPLEAKVAVATDDYSIANPSHYRSIVGALQYLTLTRPDLSYSVNYVYGCSLEAGSTHPPLSQRNHRHWPATIFYHKPCITCLLGCGLGWLSYHSKINNWLLHLPWLKYCFLVCKKTQSLDQAPRLNIGLWLTLRLNSHGSPLSSKTTISQYPLHQSSTVITLVLST